MRHGVGVGRRVRVRAGVGVRVRVRVRVRVPLTWRREDGVTRSELRDRRVHGARA